MMHEDVVTMKPPDVIPPLSLRVGRKHRHNPGFTAVFMTPAETCVAVARECFGGRGGHRAHFEQLLGLRTRRISWHVSKRRLEI